MSTRRAKDDSVFHQNRYASSPEFERGLLGNLVAKRCSVLADKNDRELIWFIHRLSHEPGGLMKLSRDLSGGTHCVERLMELSLNPSRCVKDFVWESKLRELRASYIKNHEAAFATTLGQKVSEVLDYTLFSRGLSLMEGEARTGKTFSARNWCGRHPGQSRFVEVPPGNDDVGFFRALARGLGLGNLGRYKSCDVKDRVETVLISGDLVLVLDEAQRLWPQRNLRYGFPGRIVWIMSMANAGVPIAMISTPQFIETQKAVEKNGWNGKQLTGRIKHYEPLPRELSENDLIAVARAVLPEAKQDALKALAIYARNSARYLAAIDSISTRARYLAQIDGRAEATTADVQRAMKESVIPADSKLQAALATGRNSRRCAPAIHSRESEPTVQEELTPRKRGSISSAAPFSASALVS